LRPHISSDAARRAEELVARDDRTAAFNVLVTSCNGGKVAPSEAEVEVFNHLARSLDGSGPWAQVRATGVYGGSGISLAPEYDKGSDSLSDFLPWIPLGIAATFLVLAWVDSGPTNTASSGPPSPDRESFAFLEIYASMFFSAIALVVGLLMEHRKALAMAGAICGTLALFTFFVLLASAVSAGT
jgi:hypothetical protein